MRARGHRRHEPAARAVIGLEVMPVKPERDSSPLLARLLAWIVFALMASATAYTAWIAVANFKRIGV